MTWLLWTIGSAVFSALANIARKEGLRKEHALEFATSRALVAALMVLPLAFFVDFSIPAWIMGLMFLIGVFAGFARVFFSKAYRHMEISEIAPLSNINSGFLVLLAVVFLKETISKNQVFGIGLLLIGSYVLEAGSWLSDYKAPFRKICKSTYLHFVVFGLVIYAFTALLDKYVVNSLGGVGVENAQFTMLFFIWISLSLTLSIMTALKYGFVKDIRHAWKKGWFWIVMSAFCSVVSALTYYKALTLAYVGLVIPIKRVSSLFETVMGGEIFHESRLKSKVAACILMIAGAALVTL